MTATAAGDTPLRPDHRFTRLFLIVAVIVPFLATLLAMVYLWNRLVTWRDVALLVTMYVLTGIGVTVGFHRLLTHRSFETWAPVRFILLMLGTMAVEAGPLTWASTHLKHHAHSDGADDPHSPLDGFYHAHLGWMLDGWAVEPSKHGPWLLQDRMVVFFERTFLVWALLGLWIPYLIGGWTGLLWGGLVRVFMTHHVTWSVNSVCHTFGTRSFHTRDRSRNNFLVGLLAFGEGWHNNHHAFPNSAFHGLAWWQIDVSAYVIRGLERCGLAWAVRRPSPEQMARRRVVPGISPSLMAAEGDD
jgi:stearoyl-CoA desaturase (delta-9 desaturase)